jgi:DNA-binding NarL/FixJ family response regulator
VSLRVLVVDDHPMFRDGLRFTLSQSPQVREVREASDGQDAVDQANSSRFDVVVMDLHMPRLDGIAATPAVVATGARVLVLSMSEDDASVLSAVRAGAIGYLVKGADAEQVVSAVTSAAAGHAVFGAGLACRVLDLLGQAVGPRGTGGPPGRVGDLSAREHEVLELLAQGLTNNQIAQRLYLSPITVRNHVSHILAKLQVSDRRQAMLRMHNQPQPGAEGS